MSDKRRWLPRWQRIELVAQCLEHGMTRRQAAAWRRVSPATVQYWIDHYRDATDEERRSGRTPRGGELAAVRPVPQCTEMSIEED
jgi:transposase